METDEISPEPLGLEICTVPRKDFVDSVPKVSSRPVGNVRFG